MRTIYLSLSDHVAGGTFFMKSPVSVCKVKSGSGSGSNLYWKTPFFLWLFLLFSCFLGIYILMLCQIYWKKTFLRRNIRILVDSYQIIPGVFLPFFPIPRLSPCSGLVIWYLGCTTATRKWMSLLTIFCCCECFCRRFKTLKKIQKIIFD